MKRKHLTVLFVSILTFLLISCFELAFYAGENEPPRTVPKVPKELICTTYYDTPLSDDFQVYIKRICDEYNVDFETVLGIISAESSFNINAVSDDCIGLMQVKSIHLDELKQIGIIDLFDPHQNIEAGVYLYSKAIKKSDDINHALMIYNNGFSGAQQLKNNGIKETCYTKKVLRFAAELNVKMRVYEEVERIEKD